MKRWEWREGSHPPANLPAEQAGKELERIRQKRGILIAPVLVEEAKRKRSPFHNHIHGDSDEEAAYAQRLWRAQDIIGACKYKVVNGDEGPLVQAFVNVTTERGREYVPASEAAEQADLRDQVRKSLLIRLATIRRELGGWDEFSGAAAAVDEAHERLKAA